MPDRTYIARRWQDCAEAYDAPVSVDLASTQSVTIELTRFTCIYADDAWRFDPPSPHSQIQQRGAFLFKAHSDERQFWAGMLEQKFITWQECLRGMRECRKRERIY